MKTIVVTGAGSGLGLWTAKYLLDLDYKVIMACRNPEKAQKAIPDFPEFDARKNYQIMPLDLGDFSSIKAFVQNIPAGEDICGFDCNAGITYNGPFRYTKEGIEETFGTNFLGHFLLTNLMLQKFTPERIVLISSGLHDPANKSPFARAVFREVDAMAHPAVNPDTTLKKQCEEFYATSKLCMLLFAYELERRLKARDTKPMPLINAINPGLMLSTNFGRKHTLGETIYRLALDAVFKLIGLSDNPEGSAKDVVYLLREVNSSGGYYEKGRPVPSSADSYDLEKARLLWEGSEALVGMKFL